VIDKIWREVESAQVYCWWREKVCNSLSWLNVGNGRRHRALVQTAAVKAIQAENW
jgi:hypothetical protein